MKLGDHIGVGIQKRLGFYYLAGIRYLFTRKNHKRVEWKETCAYCYFWLFCCLCSVPPQECCCCSGKNLGRNTALLLAKNGADVAVSCTPGRRLLACAAGCFVCHYC